MQFFGDRDARLATMRFLEVNKSARCALFQLDAESLPITSIKDCSLAVFGTVTLGFFEKCIIGVSGSRS